MILSASVIENVINQALSHGADFAEVYAENTYTSQLGVTDSKLSDGMVGRLNGAGIRLFKGTEQIYTHTNDLSEKSLVNAALVAATALKGSGSTTTAQPLKNSEFDFAHKYKTLPWELEKDVKASHLFRLDKTARDASADVSQVMANLSETHKNILVANSEGLLSQEVRNYVAVYLSVVVERDGKREVGSQRIGRLAGSEIIESISYEEMAKKAAQSALLMLTADYAPAGEFPVIIDNGFGGVIFHEACGHGLETTSVAKDASVFCGLLNKKIAESCVTAIDDGTIPNENGSLVMDDEGIPTQKTVLIDKGVLKSYLVDKIGARKTDYKPTGSGRRQNYRYAPTSRMRNTYIAAGDSTLDEMIKDVDFGIYAKEMGGGSVTPGTGAYNFAVNEAYLVRNGKIEKPIKGASLIGKGIETLGRIVKVGNNLKLAAGNCGSVSGWVPVTVGQPPILVSKITVGGRS